MKLSKSLKVSITESYWNLKFTEILNSEKFSGNFREISDYSTTGNYENHRNFWFFEYFDPIIWKVGYRIMSRQNISKFSFLIKRWIYLLTPSYYKKKIFTEIYWNSNSTEIYWKFQLLKFKNDTENYCNLNSIEILL